MKEPNSETVSAVLAAFDFAAEAREIRTLGQGLIHDTYLVRTPQRSWVLQRLNREVFPDLELVGRNIERVVQALQTAAERGDYPLVCVAPLTTPDRRSIAEVAGGSWRLTPYLESTYTVRQPDTPQRAEAAAEAFGRFCAALVALDTRTIGESIPGFHDFDLRLEQLRRAAEEDRAGRGESVSAEIEFCVAQAAFGGTLRRTLELTPRRVCHYDTKIDNLLFDAASDLPRAVIDLDTCMPGWWMHDFGDIVRTFCNSEPEDSPRPERVRVREELFAAVASGFTRPLQRHFAAGERESLWLGARAIPLMIGMRFLADHLAGDSYFHVSRENHNLDRARNQIALYRDLTMREEELKPLLQPGEDRTSQQ